MLLFLSLLLAGINASYLARFQVPDSHATQFADITEKFDLDVWGTPLPGNVDIHVTEEMFAMIVAEGFAADILIDDVEKLIMDEKTRLAHRRPDADFFEEYQSYESIVQFCQDLVEEFPNLMSNFSVGTTYEGRDIYGLRITSGSGSNKPVFVFNGGIHAREWISHATVTFMINELVRGYGNDAAITRYLDGLEFIIIPVLNPDGYAYSRDSERLWRKNREPNAGSNCVGTDLNRNWGYMWNTGGSSNIPCSDSYHGSGPFSCIESRSVEILANSTENMVAYIDFHAYSQLIMTPWGYTTDFPPNDAYIKEVGMKQKDAIEAVYGTVYQVGNIANIIYVASGSSADYFHGVHGVDLSYGYELRDTGRYGFLLPPDQIIPSGIETFEALKVICEELV